MTLLVVLMLGAGVVLIVSSIQTDPTTGKSVSVLQTISNIWNNKLTGSQAGFAAGANAAAALSTANPNNPPNNPPNTGGKGGATATGMGGGDLSADAYRAAIVRAVLQSQR